jgi:LmbE family N-acetylglucosaminyl deacetylase
MRGLPAYTDLGSILAVFAHPDDEAYIAGALMAIAADAGRRVVCVTATRGELGFPDDDPRPIEERKAIREAELEACLEVLGVGEHHWLDYPDSGCATVPVDEPVGRLREVLQEVLPDTVLTFGPDGGTYHDDHVAVSRWTTLACRSVDRDHRLLYAANTPEWAAMFNAALDLDDVMMVEGVEPPTTPMDQLSLSYNAHDELADRKVRALRCQASQVEPLVAQAGAEAFRELVREESFRDPTPDDWVG